MNIGLLKKNFFCYREINKYLQDEGCKLLSQIKKRWRDSNFEIKTGGYPI